VNRTGIHGIVALLVTVGLAGSCTPSGGDATALEVVPVATATAVATTVPLEVPAAAPPAPSPTPVPSATVVLESTPTATEVPQEPTALPTAAPEPTAVPAPTAAPEPTAVLAPTAAPEPTAVPAPTAAPEPTAASAPESTATPEPEVAIPVATAVTTTDVDATHTVTSVGYVTLGQAGGVVLIIPAAQVERIGFHEASHPGSQAINAAGTGLDLIELASRGRGTAARSAADIVVPPGEPLRAPVTGTVVASSSYVLYCEHQDQLVYIEPDGFPGWQVRLFHIQGEIPAVGTRTVAGETIVATGANTLPFESQVDEFTAEPSWPHVHLEVVDTTVPDDRPPGGGC